MLVLNETEHVRNNIFAKDITRDNTVAVSSDNNQRSCYTKKKLNALNRKFLKSLGFIVRKDD